MFQHIWRSGVFPAAWRIALVLPFLKPGKNPHLTDSYRPIALTSCFCKLLEKMVNNRLMWYLEYRDVLSPCQYGFRASRSTLEPLTLLETDIGNAFTKKELVSAVFFDLSKAYDCTWRRHILNMLYTSGLRGNLPIFISNFLTNRKFKVMLNGFKSAEFIQYEGVPQGSILSTTCFILAINDLPKHLPLGVRCSMYVDDIALWYTGASSWEVETKLQSATDAVSSWMVAHGFTLSQTKTVAMTFTRKRVIPNMSLRLKGFPIRFVTHTKFLGVFLDQRLLWIHHIDYLRKRCTDVLALMKKMSHLSWGADRHSLLYLHDTLLLPVLDYACHLYGSASPRLLMKLDTLHNSGLRIATRAFCTSPVQSLYADTGRPPLHYRRIYLSLAYLARIQHSSKLVRSLSAALVPTTTGSCTFRSFAIRVRNYLADFSIPEPCVFIQHALTV